LDCSLESNKTFRKILLPNGWHPGPGEVVQGGQKVLRLWRHLQAPSKNFFRVQTTRLAAPFDASTRSVSCTGSEIFLCKATCQSAVFCEPLELTWTSKC